MRIAILLPFLFIAACDPPPCKCEQERADKQAAEVRADKAERMLRELQDAVISDKPSPPPNKQGH